MKSITYPIYDSSYAYQMQVWDRLSMVWPQSLKVQPKWNSHFEDVTLILIHPWKSKRFEWLCIVLHLQYRVLGDMSLHLFHVLISCPWNYAPSVKKILQAPKKSLFMWPHNLYENQFYQIEGKLGYLEILNDAAVLLF